MSSKQKLVTLMLTIPTPAVLQKQLDDCSSVMSFFGDAIKDKDGIFEFAQLLFGGGYVMTGHEVLSKQPTERSYHFVRKMG